MVPRWNFYEFAMQPFCLLDSTMELLHTSYLEDATIFTENRNGHKVYYRNKFGMDCLELLNKITN